LESIPAHKAAHYRLDIDGLRAAAVCMVVANHAFPSALPGGYAGVDVFFVISGFVITSLIAAEAASGVLCVRQFYFRRVRRIFPALLTVLLSCMAVGWFFLSPNDIAQLGRQTAAGALFVPNLLFLSETGYFDPAAETKPLLHLWSLGVEEQFYLIWPLTFILMRRLTRRTAVLTAALTAASLALFIFVGARSENAAFYLPFTRFWEIFAGCALALGRKNLRISRLGLDALSLAGLCLLCFAAAASQRGALLAGAWPLLPVLGAGALILAGPGTIAGRLLSLRPIVFVGSISYPLYLWHWPLLAFSHLMSFGAPSTGQRAACVAASFALAFLTFKFVEAPIRFAPARTRAAASALSGRLLGLMALAGLAGAALFATDGARFRFPEEVRTVLAYQDYEFMKDARFPGCWLDKNAPFSDFAPMCFLGGDQTAHPGVLIWGDSHAARLYPGLKAVLGEKASISQLTRDGCPAVSGFGNQLCQDSNKLVMDYVRRTPPRSVILFSVWPSYATSELAGQVLEKSMALTIEQLRLAGVREISVVGPFPIWSAPLPGIMFRSWTYTRRLPSRLMPANEQSVSDMDDALHRRALASGASYFSLVDLLCNADGCLTSVPGSPGELLTWDYGHLTTAGARFVAGSFFKPL
jgi:peptidoglycan/LPS O-acetylase OafA/YrhL